MDATPHYVANSSTGFFKVVHNFIMDMQQSAVHFDSTFQTSEIQERENIEDESPIEKPFRILDYIDRQCTKDPFCVICDFEMPITAVKNHLSEECHKNAFVIYGCNNIVQKEKSYHCKICDIEIPTIERVYRHIKLVKHLSATNKKNATIEAAKHSKKSQKTQSVPNEQIVSCIYIKKSDDKKYFCQICAEGGLFVWYKSLNFHIASTSHKEALVKYACDNIVAQGMKKYFCKCCNRKFSHKKLFWHIKSDEHLRNADRERSERKVDKKVEKIMKETSLVPPKNMQKNAANDQVSQNWETPILFCRYIAQQTAMKFFCQICDDTRLRILRPDVNNHIKGNRHRESLKKYGCDYIIFKENELYYCTLCKCELVDRDMVYVHIKDEKHLNSVENSLCQNGEIEEMIPDLPNSKENYRTYTRSREKKARLKSVKPEKSQPMIKEKKAENVFNTVAQFHRYVFIASSDEKTFFCRICEDNSLIESKNVRNHSRGYEHKAALKKFGCDNIVPIEDNKILCKCCQWELVSRKKACQHVKTKEHLRNAKKEKSNEDNCLQSSVERLIGSNLTVEEDLPIKKAPKKVMKLPEPTETKTCIYLQNLSQNIYHCRICDGAESIVYRKRLNNHITGRAHNDSLRKYACDSIIPKEKNNYYCNRCDCKIGDLEEVYLHVRDEKHWSSPKVPYCQNMISNFVLEESALESEDDAEENDAGIAESAVKEECSELSINYSNEQANRDLSLHYISSDPDVLCKGEIPKLMKPFAVRITKQRVDSPYCLICDYEISEYSAVDDHVMGKCHAKSLVIYGCDNIVRRDEGKFHCGSCDREINGIESVYRHIKTKAHLKRIRPEEFNDQYYKTTSATISMTEGTKERLEVRQQAGDAEDQKPAEFNMIVSSLSADLSRMLASLKVNPTPKEKKDKKKSEKKSKPRKIRFKETSPDREDGFSCAVCDITFPRKSDLHSHMTSHFSEEFEHTAKDPSDEFVDRIRRSNKEKFLTSNRRKFPNHCLGTPENLSDHEKISAVKEQISHCSFR